MSDDTTVLRRLPEGVTSTRIIGGIALVVTVGVLIVGAFLAGGSSGAYEGAGDRITTFYEEQDVEGMLAAFPDGAVPDEQVDGTRNALSQILRPGATVVEVADPVDVAGVPVVRVSMSDQIDWCVVPDGGILPRCRVGEIPVDVSGDERLESPLAQVDLPLEGPGQLTIGLSVLGDEAVTLDGVQLVDADGEPVAAELGQAVSVQGGQAAPADPAAPTIDPGTQLYLGWFLDFDAADTDLRLEWDGGALDLDLRRTRWFVG